MKKINQYVFIQIFKSCTLIFFIFVSIAWLLQISRLFSYLSNFQVKFLDILNLSIFLLPNIINVILPFIVIFGIIIAFIKMDKDKEIIAIYSLGLSINQIKKPIVFFLLIISLFYISLNYFLSPIVYDIYKNKEFNLRNLVNLEKVNIANFIEINENTIIDFIKEKLQFETYKFKFPNKKNEYYSNIDKNSITIYQSIKNKDYKIILEKIIDTLIIITIIYFFYCLNIKKNNFSFKNILNFLVIIISIIIIHNVIKNIDLSFNNSVIIMLFNILLPYCYIFFKKRRIE